MPTFAELKSKVSSRLLDKNNTAVSAAEVGTALNDAISYWKWKPFWFNEKEDSISLVSGTEEVTNFPTDFLTPAPTAPFVIRYGQVNWDVRLVTQIEYDGQFTENGSGLPYIIAPRNDSWYVFFIPDQNYTMKVRYFQDYTDLSADDDTNDFTTYADQLILYDALSRLQAELRQGSEMETYYTARMKDEYQHLINQSNQRRGTGYLIGD